MDVRMTRFVVLSGVLFLSACTVNRGYMPQATQTEVRLNGSNYKIIKTGVSGVSSGFSFLGIPLKSPRYADAKTRLYDGVGQKLEGRSIALVNQTFDKSYTNYLLFSIPKLTITSDVIEFTAQ